MYKIGLTGGIASGKSTVVSMLRQYDAAIIDCDIIARDVVLPGSKGLQAVVRAFGPQALLSDGTMNRAYISSIVFTNPAKKQELEEILFPLIRQEIRTKITQLEKAGEAVAFLDMPLLFEVKYQSYVNEVWLVYVDAVTQLARLMARNGYTKDEALARIRSQFPIDKKRALSQVIVDNTASLEKTEEQVKAAWNQLLLRIDKR